MRTRRWPERPPRADGRAASSGHAPDGTEERTAVKFLILIVKNVRRNLVRSLLTALGAMVLVFVVTLVWSILDFLDRVTTEKTSDLKGIVTERWQIPSQMPFTYAATLSDAAARKPGDVRPDDSMTWQFYGGTIDPAKRTRENLVFAFALEPAKLGTMMDDLELKNMPAAKAAEFRQAIDRLTRQRNGIILGRERLSTLSKRIGDRFTITSLNFQDIDLEFEVVGTFPEGRYDKSAAMNRDYLNAALDAYPRSHGGKRHPMAEKSLNLVWLRVPDTDTFNAMQHQIVSSPLYASPAVKCETASSGVATFLDAYRDLIWGMRWLLGPAILLTLSLVIANAISISVRERRLEFAVLRVLGYRPRQILALVVGEAVWLGAGAGLLSAGLTFLVINHVIGGINFPIAFFGTFLIPPQAFWWGLAVGLGTALLGSVIPAWTASSIRVTEAFAKVA
jgi:putative ABC transport system permease protein